SDETATALHALAIIARHLTPDRAPRALGPLGRARPSGPRRGGAGAGMLLQYLYAVVEGLPHGWQPPPPVVGERVERRALANLVILSSAAPVVPPASPTTLALHHEVVASALDADGLVPFRYGTALRAADVDGWLARERPALDGALASVRGRLELRVKLLRPDTAPAAAA